MRSCSKQCWGSRNSTRWPWDSAHSILLSPRAADQAYRSVRFFMKEVASADSSNFADPAHKQRLWEPAYKLEREVRQDLFVYGLDLSGDAQELSARSSQAW